MKSALILLSALLLCVITLTAQQFKVEKSEEFDEPAHGWNKLFQLSNGNTFFFQGADRDGVTITVYDKQRKLAGTKSLATKLWDLGDIYDARILGLYEINGEPVLFVNQSKVLYRVRLNPADGSLVNEEELAKDFEGSVAVDPASGCYAVVETGIIPGDRRGQTIKVSHYDANHKKINESTYPLTGTGFKYMIFSQLTVDRNKSVYLALRGYNGDPFSRSTPFRFVISRLNAGDKVFTSKQLNMKAELEGTENYTECAFNKKLNRVQVITVVKVESTKKVLSQKTTDYYATLLMYIDAESLNFIAVKPLFGEKISAYAQRHIDKDYSYSGMTSGMRVNDDNTTTILMEEYSAYDKKEFLGAIGISELNDTGAEQAGYAIGKNQVTEGYSPLMEQNKKSRGEYKIHKHVLDNARYMSYDYLITPKGHYVIFNDLPENFKTEEDESKRQKMSAITGASAFCFRLNGDNIDRFYLFGEPDSKSSAFCYIDGSDFNKASNTYSTVVTEGEGHDKKCRVAWVTFE